MKMRVTSTYAVEIVPEGEVDAAFIETTLGLRREGDYVRLVRKDVMGASGIAYLTTRPFPETTQREVVRVEIKETPA